MLERRAFLAAAMLRSRLNGSLIAVIGLTVLGALVRYRVAGQGVFADEIATYWIISTRDLGGVISTVHSTAEITPPLSFALSWLTTRIDLTPELMRAPALIAGTATIPLVYALGMRTVGRRAALVAAAMTTAAPFMIFYSAEARGYGLAMAFVLVSALAMLKAIDEGHRRWWAVYAISASAAVYTHYTTVFVLGAGLVWLLWAHPEARRAGLLASVAAAVLFLPWVSGLLGDFNSPTTAILSRLSPFNAHSVRIVLGHWSIGYPFAVLGLRDIPGLTALVMLALALVFGGARLAARWRVRIRPRVRGLDRRVVLLVALALSAPLGEALVSLGSTKLFGVRNLAVSWPAFALVLAALVSQAGRRTGLVAATLTVASFVIGGAKMLDPFSQRADYPGAARLIEREASPRDVVIEGAILSPGPLTGLDVALHRPLRVLRAGKPQERDHPFGVFDAILPTPEVARRAAAGDPPRVFLISTTETAALVADQVRKGLPAAYRRAELHAYPGIVRLAVTVFERRASPRE
jgi:hypothetical protein